MKERIIQTPFKTAAFVVAAAGVVASSIIAGIDISGLAPHHKIPTTDCMVLGSSVLVGADVVLATMRHGPADIKRAFVALRRKGKTTA